MDNLLIILNVEMLVAIAAFAMHMHYVKKQAIASVKEAQNLLTEFKTNAQSISAVHNTLVSTQTQIGARVDDLNNRFAMSQLKR